MNGIEKNITELNSYFVEKLMNSDYKLNSITEHLAKVTIDNEYTFFLWICVGSTNFGCYSNDLSFMKLAFSDSEKEQLYNVFQIHYNNEVRNPALKEERKKEYLKLKAEFETTNN
jgi:hypothetical protein